MISGTSKSQIVKDFSQELGFNFCGISTARKLDEDARRLEAWLNKGYHGSMQWMENHFDLRVDPTQLVPGAKSVITLLLNYSPPQPESNASGLRVSKYAWGHDYHEVIKVKLRSLLLKMRETFGDIEGRGFVDSAPVLERSWAQLSGLGWIGKNGNLINPRQGSFFFIATLITDLTLEPDDPMMKDYCGTCRRCIEACPTDAIEENKTINGSRCISYYTIELKDMMIPQEMEGKFNNWMFGCDTCQDVCPWNRFSKPTAEKAFTPIQELFSFSLKDWEELTEESFRQIFKNSPLKRSKYQGIRRNLRFLSSTSEGSKHITETN